MEKHKNCQVCGGISRREPFSQRYVCHICGDGRKGHPCSDAVPINNDDKFACPYCGINLTYWEERSSEFLYCDHCEDSFYDVDTGGYLSKWR